MIRLISTVLLAFSVSEGLSSLSFAQLPNTDLQMISPAFVKAGSSVEMSLSGEHLEEISALRFNDPRIKATAVTQPADEFFPKPRPVANRFTVTVPADVQPGIYEVRSQGYFGLSTARPFMVLHKDDSEIKEEGDHSERELAMELPVKTGVTGMIDSRKIDWFKFSAKKGERLLIELWSERLDSKADAMLALYDAAGRELENCRQHFGRDPMVDFTPEADGEYFIALSDILYRGGSQYFYRLKISRRPHVDFVFPPAGVPGQKTKFTFFGRNLPGGNRDSGVVINGKPLDSVEVEIALPGIAAVPKTFSADSPRQAMLAVYEHRLAGNSNLAKIGFATAPVVLEKEGGGSKPQKVNWPCEIAGRFDEPGDSDVFRFSVKKGETVWLESISDQMKASTDTVLLLRKIGKDESGKETITPLSENDDPPSFFGPDRYDATNLDTNDASLSFTADSDGEYEVKLINNLSSGSPAHIYRLAIRKASPDFQLFTTTERTITATNGRAGYPAAPLVRRGGSMVYRVIAPRRDGFDGDIVVTAEGLPKGVIAPRLVLSGDTQNGFLTVRAAADAASWSGAIRIVGKAQIAGKEVVRESRNASLVWGVIFSDSFRVRSRLDMETVLSVTEKETAPAFLQQAEAGKKWEVELGESLQIPVKVSGNGTRKGNLTVQPHGFPRMKRATQNVTIAETAKEGKLSFSCKPSGNFEIIPGRYQFVMLGIGIAKYQYNPGAIETATIERRRLEKLARDLTAKADAAKKKLPELEKELAAAKANATAASDAEKAALAKRVAEVQTQLDAAKKESADLDAKLKTAIDHRTAAGKHLNAVTLKAKEKDTKFATFSVADFGGDQRKTCRRKEMTSTFHSSFQKHCHFERACEPKNLDHVLNR